MTEETKKLILESKNIYIIPAENEPEAIPCALALFYTLKELGKNVNLLIDSLPQKLMYLVPSLDFISYPRSFVLSLPSDVANVSQIYYEKSNEALKIHLTLDKGIIKKDNISFYYSDIKPDLIITLGIKDYKKQLEKLDSFGFLLDTPIINIDNTLAVSSTDSQENLKFGKINIVEPKPISQIILDFIKSLNSTQASFAQTNSAEASIKKEIANCLLSGLMLYSENFSNSKTNSELLETVSYFMKNGADREKITAELFPKPKIAEIHKDAVFAVLQKLGEQNLEVNRENILKYFEN